MYEETIVIYSDLLFLINFSLDFICLFITDRVLNCGAKTKFLLLASLFGGLYSFVPYLFEASPIITFPLHILASLVICFIAFSFRDARRFFTTALTFIVSSALLGGIITSVYSLSSRYSDGIYSETDAISFCLICVFSAFIALSYGMICKKKIHTKSVEVRILSGSEKIGARLLVDSGNLVTEPFSSLPVIVVASSALPFPFDSPESELFPKPIRAIPFSTSAGRSCFFGFRPDKIEIIRIGQKSKIVEAFIGIDTERQTYSGYDGLMPSSLL